LLLVSAAQAQAATLYFSPASGEYATGKAFSVSVYVSSPDQAMNAAAGTISFPPDKLEVVSLSKVGSIISLWVQEPSFSNGSGRVNFEGIVLNPGFTGSAGKIIGLNFRVKSSGAATVAFSSGSVLANDGQGTNILTNMAKAEFNLVGGGAPPPPPSPTPKPTPPSSTSGYPPAPQITSPTHPDQNRWYAQKEARFEWSLPEGVTAVRLLASPVAEAAPTVSYAPPISSKEITDLTDGVWYFHLQFRNAKGWGPVSHYRFQVDTTPPEPMTLKILDGQETTNPRPTVVFDTTDQPSGIDHYNIRIGDGDFFVISQDIVKSNPYTLPPQAPGKRTIVVQAVDRAGNTTTASTEFTILAPPGLMEKIGGKITKILALLTPLVALILLFLFILWYAWRKFLSLRRIIKKEIPEAETTLHQVFDSLKEEIREQIRALESARTKRQLTDEEEKIIKRLKKQLDESEELIKSKIEEIKEEIAGPPPEERR